jgi:hypothetical protein
VPPLRLLVAGLSLRRPGFDHRSVHVWIVVDKVALGQVLLRVLRFSPVNFIPPGLHYKKNRKKLTIIITGLHNKPLGCGASVASASGPVTKKVYQSLHYCSHLCIPVPIPLTKTYRHFKWRKIKDVLCRAALRTWRLSNNSSCALSTLLLLHVLKFKVMTKLKGRVLPATQAKALQLRS